jgi:hypothetical protein
MLFILTPNVIAGQRQPQRLCAHVPTPLLNIPVALIARHSSSLEHKHFLCPQPTSTFFNTSVMFLPVLLQWFSNW